MKIKITRSRLSDALKRVSGISDGRGAPILASVKVTASKDGLALMTTNLDITLTTSVSECEVVEEGTTAVPMKKLEQIVSVLPHEDVTIESDDKEKMKIVSGSVKMSVSGLPADQFPALAPDKSSVVYKAKGSKLLGMLRKSAYAMCKDDTRKTLQSVLLEFDGVHEKAVGTDGRRLGYGEAEFDGASPTEKERQMVVPAYAVSVLQRIVAADADIVIKAEESHLTVSQFDGRDTIYTKLVDGQYPNYKRVIPARGDIDIKFDRNDMLAMLNRSLVVEMANEPHVRMKFLPASIEMSATGDDGDRAQESIPATYGGKEFELMFNPRYIIDTLKSFDSDVIVVNTSSEQMHRAIIFTGETEPNALAIVMPLRMA